MMLSLLWMRDASARLAQDTDALKRQHQGELHAVLLKDPSHLSA